MATGTVKWFIRTKKFNAKRADIDEAMYRGAGQNGGLPNNGRTIVFTLGINSAQADVDAATYPKKITA